MLVALAAAALVGAVSASPAAAVPANFWGVVPQATPSPEQLERLKRGGVDSVRIHITWDSVQPERGGAIDWAETDRVVGAVAAARMEAMPFLLGAPSWAVPRGVVPGTGGQMHAPSYLPVRNGVQRAGWRGFVSEAVRRYGPTGTFWAENPAVPRRPIRTWQIWNEANFKYFVVRPNPAEYGKLVKLSHAAARGVDRGAKIVLGGLFSYPREAGIKRGPKQAYTAPDFLDRMYKTTPGIKSKFQGVALHPYSRDFKRLDFYVEDFRSILKRHRDLGKGLWITELGWSSGGGNAFAKGRAGQAAQLKGSFRLLSKKQRPWRVQRVYWFSVDDMKGACNFCDGSGLFGPGFVPKPAWFAYVGFAGGRAN